MSSLCAEKIVNLQLVETSNTHALTTTSEMTKLLPTPEGIGGDGSEFGSAISVDGQFSLVGAKNMAGNGLVYAYQYDGVNWNEIDILSTSDGRPGDQFGHALAVSGNRAIVAIDDYSSLMGTGAVYVFEFNGVSWNETQKLIGNDSLNADRFGWSVSLDGDRALIGAIYNDQNGVDSGAAYLFEYDGSQWIQTNKIMASDGNVSDNFGWSVSLSGNQLMVGTIWHRDNFISAGATYVYEYDGNQWIETQKLIPADPTSGDRFGYDISLENNRVLISAINGDTATLTNSGTVYVFEYDGNSWTETFKLSDNNGNSYSSFGYRVSLLGHKALISNRSDNSNGIASGSAFVFEFDGIAWVQSQKLIASDGESNDRFGNSVGLSVNNILVGANNSPGGAIYSYNFNGFDWNEFQKIDAALGAAYSGFGGRVSISGNRAIIAAQLEAAAYIYQYNGLDWSLMQKLTSESQATDNEFAGSVSIDGNHVMVSDSGDDTGCEDLVTVNGDENKCENSGAVYVYEYQSGSWVMVQKLKGSEINEGGRFGNPVSLYGNQALIGQWRDDWVYVFQFNGDEWVQTQRLSDIDPGPTHRFGVAIKHNANKAIIGASLGLHNTISTSGAAYIFDFDGISWSFVQKLTPSNTNTSEYGSSLSLLGNRALVGARRDDENGTYAGAAYIYDFDGFDWLETQKLTASDAQPDDWFGFSVSLATDKLLVGAHRDDDNGLESGSVYVFDFDGSSWSETEKIVAHDGQNDDHFGVSTAFYSSGIMIGSTGIDDFGTESGAMYVISSDRPDLIFINNFE